MVKVYIKTFGCSSNQADSEVIAGILSKKFKITNKLNEASIVIINSCGVKLRTQNKIIGYIKNLKNKKIYVGGCLPKMLNLKKHIKVHGYFDTNSITKILNLIEKNQDILSDKKENRINLPVVRTKQHRAIINISQGCQGNCSYCSVKLARGNLKSYKKEEIIKTIKKALKEKCNLIYLSSQDNGCYGLDINTNLPSLLKDVIKIKGEFKIKIGMINPNYAKLYLKDLIKIYKSEKIMKILHIPLQSGSNKLLKEMNRKYKIEDFIKITNTFRKNIPNMNILTDIITGYPTETKKDFQKTLNLIKKINPEVINISKFTSRPKTKASKLKQLPSQIIKERSLKLTKEIKKIKS
ncbi:MAG: tRNA (N(6)-L-threonylcarbamoyladenosine(37)-C(2))-methylthiotransferase [Nanoarchaeota archaeon]|nr:tRNA (N(6)-L-threonylcarbamoyladenosine(37)-C(2))-methylthiotransferase [Nanoarchaeota archaeon]